METEQERSPRVRQDGWKFVRHSVMHVTTRFAAIITVAGASGTILAARIV